MPWNATASASLSRTRPSAAAMPATATAPVRVPADTHHMIGSDEPARLLGLRFPFWLQDGAIRTRDRNCILRHGCASESENKRNRTFAAELDLGSETNHAISQLPNGFHCSSERAIESTAATTWFACFAQN